MTVFIRVPCAEPAAVRHSEAGKNKIRLAALAGAVTRHAFRRVEARESRHTARGAEGLLRRAGGEYKIRPAVPAGAVTRRLFGWWRPEETDATARGGWSGIK